MRTSKSGKTVYLDIQIWFDEEQNNIHIAGKGITQTTVKVDRKSKRGHPNLFKKLAKCLREAGAPAPPEK